MITGVRKAGEITSTPQRTKTHKVNNEEDELMEAENKSDSEMIKEMWSMMKSMKTKTEQACESAEKATQAAEKAATEVQEVKESITGISLNIKEFQDKDKSFEKDMAEVKARLGLGSGQASTKTMENMYSETCRELEVIAGGLEEPEDEDSIIKQVQTVLDGMGMQGKYVDVELFGDPAKVAKIKFRSEAGKIGFYKKANTLDTKWSVGRNMWFKDNDTLEKRAIDKELGRIKYELTETKKVPTKDVKIWWKRESKDIEVKGVKVAWVTANKTAIEKTGMALEVKEQVEQCMKEWKEKRNME